MGSSAARQLWREAPCSAPAPFRASWPAPHRRAPTPWGSWVTCEETTVGTGQGYEKAHGYNFEVPAAASGPVPPVPLEAMGRFVHEAIAVDPRTGWVYETEDRGTSGIYRFIPARPGVLADGGTLEMLAVVGKPNYDTCGA